MAITKPASGSSDLWDDIGTTFTRRCALIGIYGDTDSGRSTLALKDAPGPVAYIHSLEKVDGLLEDYKNRGGEIRPCSFGGSFRGTVDEIMDQASRKADRMERAIYDAYGWARTIILDTHTEGWEIVQLARLGSLNRDDRKAADQKKGQLVYSELNNRWRSIFKEFRVQADRNNRTSFIVIGQTKAEYSGNQATGRTVHAGQKETPYMCDVIIRTKKSRQNEFTAIVEKPWWNSAARDLDVAAMGLPLSLPTIMATITETDEEEWR